MTSSKIMSQSINLFANPKISVNSNSRSNSASSDFTSVMDKSLKTKQTVSKKDACGEKKELKAPTKYDIAQKDGTRNVTNKSSTAYKKDIQNVSSKDDVSSVTDTNELEEGLNESVLEEVKALYSTTLNTLTKGLNITKEELEKQLEFLGLTMFDMLNMDNLKQLILNVNGASDITDVLTDETLAKTLRELTFAVEEIGQENTLNLTTDGLNEAFHQVMDEAVINNVDSKMDDSTNDEVKEVKIPEVSVFVEKDDANSSSDYSKSSKEEADTTEYSKNILDTIMNNLSGINNENPLNEGITKVNEIREIVSQIVEQIKIHIKPEQTSMELQLNPEHLGKLQLSVASKEGVLTAHFTVSNQTVKEAIESQMANLRDNLTNQGLKVDTIEVTVSNFEFSGSNEAGSDNNQGNSKKRRFLYDDAIEVNNVSEEPVAMNELMEQNGTTVDYSA